MSDTRVYAQKLKNLRTQFSTSPIAQILKALDDAEQDEDLAITYLHFGGATPTTTSPLSTSSSSSSSSSYSPTLTTTRSVPLEIPTRKSMILSYTNIETQYGDAANKKIQGFIQRVLEANKIACLEPGQADPNIINYLQNTHHITDWTTLQSSDVESIVVTGLPLTETVNEETKHTLKDYLMFLKQLESFFPRVAFGKIQKSFALDHMHVAGDKLVALSLATYYALEDLEQRVGWVKNLNISGKIDHSLEADIQEEKTKIEEFKMALQGEIGTHVNTGGVTDPPAHVKTEIVLINDSGNLETNKVLLKLIGDVFPELPSRTVVVVGNTGVGKSTLIANLTPIGCQKPAVATQKDTPVSGNVHLFDAKWDLKIANDKGGFQIMHTEPIRILDVEGLGAYAHALPVDLANRLSNLPDAQKQALAKKRWNLVQQFPRLCFAISDVIIYVVNNSMAQDIVSILRNFVMKGQQKLGRAWSVALIIVFNRSDFTTAQKTIDELTAMWTDILDKDDNFLTYTFNSIDCIALPHRETPEAYRLWYERMNDLKIRINQRLEKRSKYDRGQWCRLVQDVVHKFNGVIDPSTIITDDWFISTKTLKQCFWKFEAIQQYMHEPSGPPPTKEQFIWTFKAIVSLYAMLVADKATHNVLMRPTIKSLSGPVIQPQSPLPVLPVRPLPERPALLQEKSEFLKIFTRNNLSTDELAELRDASFDVLPVGLSIAQIDGVHKKLHKLTSWLYRKAPCGATNKQWVDVNGNPVRCIRQKHDHEAEDYHLTSYHLMERPTSDSTVLERVIARLDRILLKILPGTRFKRWAGVWQSYENIPTLTQTVALYWKVYNENVNVSPDTLFKNITSVHKDYPSSIIALQKLPQIDKCFVCLINTVSRVSSVCGHMFCNFCVQKMKQFNLQCPLCQRPLEYYDMSMHILSTNNELLFEEACFVDFVKSISIESARPLLDGYTIVAVVGTFPDEIAAKQIPIPDASWKEWDYFLHLLGGKTTSMLKGYRNGGTQIPAWTRCAIYKSKNILFLHYKIFAFELPVVRMLSVLSHQLVLFPDEECRFTYDVQKIANFPLDYPQLTGSTPTPMRFCSLSVDILDALVLASDAAKISPVIFAHLYIEMLSVETFEPEPGVLLISSVTKSLYQLLPRLAEFFRENNVESSVSDEQSSGEASTEEAVVLFGSLHAMKLLEKFLLKSCIIQIVDALLVRHSQPKGTFCFFEWNDDIMVSMQSDFAKHVNTARDMLIVHCALILKHFYEKRKIDYKQFSEVDSIISRAKYVQQIIEGCFKRPGGRYGFPVDLVLAADGSVNSWFPIVAYHSNLRSIESYFGKKQFENLIAALADTPVTSACTSQVTPQKTKHLFCSMCIKLMQPTQEEVECSHIICAQCSEGLITANNQAHDSKIDSMLCPVCGKLSMKRASTYVMNATDMADRVDMITAAIKSGLIYFNVIKPDTIRTKIILGTHVYEAYLHEVVAKTTFTNNELWRFNRAVGLLMLLHKHPNIIKLKGAYGPSQYVQVAQLTCPSFMATEWCPFTLATVGEGWLTWPRAVILMRDVACALSAMHKIGWLCRKIAAEDIGVFVNEDPPRAVLRDFYYVCPANAYDQIKEDQQFVISSAIPASSESSTTHTKENEIFCFGQLLLLVCTQAFSLNKKKQVANWVQGGVAALPNNFPSHIKTLIGSVLNNNHADRLAAQDIYTTLNKESVDCESKLRYYRVRMFAEKWIKSFVPEQNLDLFQPHNKFLATALSEFCATLKATYEIKTNTNTKTPQQSPKEVMYQITNDIREISTMIANLYGGINQNLKSKFYFMRDFVEKEFFKMCGKWYIDAYRKEFCKEDEVAVDVCQTEKYRVVVSEGIVNVKDAEHYYHEAALQLLDMSTKSSPKEMVAQLALAMQIVEKTCVRTQWDITNLNAEIILIYLAYKAQYPTIVSDAVMLSNYFSNYDYNTDKENKIKEWVTAFFEAQEYILKELPKKIITSPSDK